MKKLIIILFCVFTLGCATTQQTASVPSIEPQEKVEQTEELTKEDAKYLGKEAFWSGLGIFVDHLLGLTPF